MTTNNLEQFYQIVLQDSIVQEQLKSLTDRESFSQMVIQLGAKNGFNFTTAEVDEQLNAGKNVGMRELCEEELEAVAGGAPHSDAWTTLFGPC